ncbi:crotonase/enoyl-CoA hydratase family protein [Mycolicibacterium thermoresistibile]|jgi:enoyl-CoA hydratase|uniref:Enoyl-CoA hydratase n=2 Tax=Mycolicibacterium thermoresistibile TaxID=1797 RepID=G7CKK7_MYCT3|nr:crotonase/enoyl-CoA hydratase family protein [Mycolicibacterium thermoresistibile]EHI11717.1 enoyl-CoA hydratase [Mycolicibacterium thermoresistibile ATCC 19527]MCV7187856.1 crotonase/enoyl-CoA hydratase family protein [Mycolicibacterium thermoresistibile]GAT15994.1 enoyl-CoA hydratase/carnithine racemase [Mycolicibacterium thermoresistibile]SNW17040.1 enoyl-CoA hydratase/carnithine racemase [Mycolicibacterium thermoresistibile]
MSSTVEYQLTDSVATITMDDGKVNVLSPAMQGNLNEALDRAEQDGAKAVVLAGNSRVFSGGFDLSVFSSGDVDAALGMLRGGFELAVRALTFPVPVIMAATGPAIAMGSFLLLCGDHRVGSERTRCQANEVAIGMILPVAALEIMRMRLTPAAYQHAVSLATTFTGDAAIRAGWLDEVVDTDRVLPRAREFAAEVATTVHAHAHLASKLKARDAALKAIRAGIDGIATEFTGG